MPPIKENCFICTIVVDVFITEFCIFSASHSAAKSYNTLKDKTENKLWKRMDINSVSKRNPQEANIHVKVITFSPGFFALTTSP